ncbi:MAG: tRNA-dihydrouridine synthase family protein [Deltaproteobacteria bacterium]|nr:MAG: tRNA-dihydrouridine synthase family protein [Deltaproteobacteria bacterium]
MSVSWPSPVVLAPLTKGGTLPFRRLCVGFGAQVTCSEMAYAHNLARGLGRELALLRHHDDERCFGVQIAAHKPELGAEGVRIALEHGAKWVDLNCGCPIHDTVKRGMGARLLQRPQTLAEVTRAMVEAAGEVPITVKIRLGYREGRENAEEIGKRVQDAGASALIVHGRTREQRYSRAADWEAIGRLQRQLDLPVYGNGDVITWYEAEHRLKISGAAGVMVARGALIKPWIFQEIAEGRELCLDGPARIEVYHRLATYMKDYFGADEIGRKRTLFFLSWHFGFFCRYLPLPRETWEARSLEHPLMQTRDASPSPHQLDDPLEAMLADGDTDLHRALAELLWASPSAREAIEAASALAQQRRDEGTAPRSAGRVNSGGWG